MIDPTLFKTVQELGLSENEAKVYVSSVALGSSTVLKIAKHAGVKRTTTYSVIESLQEQGLMSIEVRGFKSLYVAESPEKLEFVIENRKRFLKEQMPELMALYNLKGGESSLKYYEGLEAVKNIYTGLLKDTRLTDKYYIVSNIQDWYKQDPKFFEDFLNKRAKLNIQPKILMEDSEKAREHKKFCRNYNVDAKILPKGRSLSTNFVVVPNRVVIHQLTPPIMAIVIENKSVIKMHQEFFEIMWDAVDNSIQK